MRRAMCGWGDEGAARVTAPDRAREGAEVRAVAYRGARGAVLAALALLGAVGCHRGGRTESAAAGSVSPSGAMRDRGEAAARADAEAVLASARADAHIIALLRAASDGEVRSGAAAIARAVNPDVTAYAHQMINAHTALDARLGDFAMVHSIAPQLPDQSLPSRQAKELAQLAPLAGAAFDQAYATQQLHAHRRALAIVEGARARARSASLRTFLADSVAPAVAAHLRGAEYLVQRLTRPETM